MARAQSVRDRWLTAAGRARYTTTDGAGRVVRKAVYATREVVENRRLGDEVVGDALTDHPSRPRAPSVGAACVPEDLVDG